MNVSIKSNGRIAKWIKWNSFLYCFVSFDLELSAAVSVYNPATKMNFQH